MGSVYRHSNNGNGRPRFGDVDTLRQVEQGFVAAGSSRVYIDNVNYNNGLPPDLEPDVVQDLISSLQTNFTAMDERRYRVDDELEGTCEWLLETEQWQRWQDCFKTVDVPRILWIKGKAGTGKSTVMKFAVERGHDAEDNEIVLVHFFNARGSDLEKTTEGMYRTLLVQLLEALPDPKLERKSLRCVLPHGGLWSLHKLKDLFSRLIRANSHRYITCFIDALDECDTDQARDMVGALRSIIERKQRDTVNLRICLASRYYPKISAPETKYIDLPIGSQEGHEADIAGFIEKEVWIDDEHLADKARSEMQRKANGVFLWCHLVARILNKKHDEGKLDSEEAIMGALQEIPGELSALFMDILGMSGGKPGAQEPATLLCLQWVLFTRQSLSPLRLWMLIQSVVSMDQEKPQGSRDVAAPDEKIIGGFILHASRGLVEIVKRDRAPLDEPSHLVQVIHESVRDFLLKEKGLARLMRLDMAMPDAGLLAKARSYERLRDICREAWVRSQHDLKVYGDWRNRWEHSSFLFYAKAAQESGIADQSRFLESLRRDWQHWRGAPWWDPEVKRIMVVLILGSCAALIRPLYRQLVAEAGGADHRDIAQMLRSVAAIQNTECPDILGCLCVLVEEHNAAQTPGMRCDLLQRLGSAIDWKKKWDWDIISSQQCCLFQMATWGDELGHWFLVALVHDGQHVSQLCDGASKGFASTLCHLLRNSIVSLGNVVLFDEQKVGALHWAVETGHVELAELLLQDPDLTANSDDSRGRTALHYAVLSKQHNMVKFLLAITDIDVNIKDGYLKVPLHVAAKEGNVTAANLLIQCTRTDLDARSSGGQTPLMMAIQYCNLDVVQALIHSARLDITSRDSHGRTALHFAATADHLGSAKALLDAGAKSFLNVQDEYGNTPLHRAVYRPGLDLVQFLLGEGGFPSLNLQNKQGETPLHIAVRAKNLDLIKVLLGEGGFPSFNLQNKQGETPLHIAVRTKNLDLIKVSLDEGGFPSLHVRDSDTRTPREVALHQISELSPAYRDFDQHEVEAFQCIAEHLSTVAVSTAALEARNRHPAKASSSLPPCLEQTD